MNLEKASEEVQIRVHHVIISDNYSKKTVPDGMDFSGLGQEDTAGVMNRLNNRSRRCLGFETPSKVFFETDPPVAFQT